MMLALPNMLVFVEKKALRKHNSNLNGNQATIQAAAQGLFSPNIVAINSSNKAD